MPNFRRCWNRSLLLKVALLCLFLLLFESPFVWARAGGGGGGGGGVRTMRMKTAPGGGQGSVLPALVLGGMALSGIGLIYLLAWRNDPSSRKRMVKLPFQQVQEVLARIGARDNEFTKEQVLTQCREILRRAQVAWDEQDLDQFRMFASDGMAAKFGTQFDLQSAENYRNRVVVDKVLDQEIVDIQTGVDFDTVQIFYAVTAADWNEDLTTERGDAKRKPRAFFREYWTFQRPVNASESEQVRGVVQEASQKKWILSEITQFKSFHIKNPQDIFGMEDLIREDPRFNAFRLRDRVSVMFWWLRQAELHRDIKFIAPVAHPDFLLKIQSQLSKKYRHAYVGSVEILRAEKTESEGWQVQVKIEWYANRRISFPTRNFAIRMVRRRVSIFTVFRAVREKTPEADHFSSISCTNCHAVLQPSEQGSCVSCGKQVNNGRSDWVLIDVKNMSERASINLSRKAVVRSWIKSSVFVTDFAQS